MGPDHCPRCDRPYTAGEVTGFGVLRPRPAALGGPWIDFACPGCRYALRLLPHGSGRYAAPGEPPPPVPSERDRQVPWRRDVVGAPASVAPEGAREEGDLAARAPEAGAKGRRPAPPPRAAGASKPSPPPAEAASAGPAESPLDGAGARAALGVDEAAGPDEVEDAFRRLALLCHPDKFAHLDADFQDLAARKFRRLQAARDYLLGAG